MFLHTFPFTTQLWSQQHSHHLGTCWKYRISGRIPASPLEMEPDDSHAHRRASSSASHGLWWNLKTTLILSYHESHYGYPLLADFLHSLLYVLIPDHRCLSVPVLTRVDTAAPDPVKSSSPTCTPTPPPSPRNAGPSSLTQLGWSSALPTMRGCCMDVWLSRKWLLSLPCLIHLWNYGNLIKITGLLWD